jgi:AcrR family transcriptional regulator
MEKDSEMKARIAEAARQRFLRYGFSRVTTEEIAQDLGISKKTLYQHYPTKRILLEAAIARMEHEIQEGIEALLRDERLDVLEKAGRLMALVGGKISRVERPFLEDLQRIAPEVWKGIAEFRRRVVFPLMGRLIREGVQNGTFRKDLDLRLLVPLYFTVFQNTFTPEALSQLPEPPGEVFGMLFRLLFQGMLTEEARAGVASRRGLFHPRRGDLPSLIQPS